MADTTQDVLIKVKSDITPIKAFNAEIRKTKEEVARASLEFGKQSKEYDNASNKLKKLQTGLADVKKSVSEAGNAAKMSKFQLAEFGENLTVVSAGLVAAATSAVMFGKQLLAAAQEGAEFGVLLESFKSIGGAEIDLDLMDIAAAGNLTKQELIQFSLQMNQVGVTVDKTRLLLDAIERQADATGKGFQDANESVKKFISSGATRSLAGFMDIPKLKEEVDKLNKSFTDSGKVLTDEQAELNRTQAVLNLYGDASEKVSPKIKDNADKMATLNTKIANFQIEGKLALSEALIPLIDKLPELSKQLGITELSGKNFINDFVKEMTKSFEATAKEIEVIIKAFDRLKTFINTMDAIDFKTKLSFFTGGFGQGSTGEVIGGEPLITQNPAVEALGFGKEQAQQAQFIAEQSDETLQNIQTVFSSVSQTMSLIGITTDSFLGKLVTGFGTVLTIMESIKAVNSILSFIPGFASGGNFGGGPMWVGEQGKELLFPNTSGYIMNHSDSMRFVNQNNSSNNVNVYLSGNIDVQAALRKDNKKYRTITIKQ